MLTLVPFNLGHHPARLGPAFDLVTEAGVGHDRLLGWSADRPLEEVADPLLQDLIGRQPDGEADALGLQQLVDLRLGKGRIGTKREIDAALAVAGDHRLQHQAPILGAVNVPGPKDAALQVTELVEQEERLDHWGT